MDFRIPATLEMDLGIQAESPIRYYPNQRAIGDRDFLRPIPRLRASCAFVTSREALQVWRRAWRPHEDAKYSPVGLSS
jgi:hypothetical protein